MCIFQDRKCKLQKMYVIKFYQMLKISFGLTYHKCLLTCYDVYFVKRFRIEIMILMLIILPHFLKIINSCLGDLCISISSNIEGKNSCYCFSFQWYKRAQLQIRKSNVRTRSHKKKNLKIKKPNTERFRRSIAYRGPKLWNLLSQEVQCCDN